MKLPSWSSQKEAQVPQVTWEDITWKFCDRLRGKRSLKICPQTDTQASALLRSADKSNSPLQRITDIRFIFIYFIYFFIEVSLIYNVVLITAV